MDRQLGMLRQGESVKMSSAAAYYASMLPKRKAEPSSLPAKLQGRTKQARIIKVLYHAKRAMRASEIAELLHETVRHVRRGLSYLHSGPGCNNKTAYVVNDERGLWTLTAEGVKRAKAMLKG